MLTENVQVLQHLLPDFYVKGINGFLWEQYGGFIAGGCARVLATATQPEEIDSYLVPRRGRGYSNNAPAWHAKSGRGDIDIFFEKRENAHSFIEYVSMIRSIAWQTTVTKAAHQINTHLGVCLQAVTAFCGTPEEVLQRFDIDNVKVAFDTKNGFIFDDEELFFELQNEKRVQVSQWSNWTLHRVAKMADRFGLKVNITPEVIEAFSKLTDDPTAFGRMCRKFYNGSIEQRVFFQSFMLMVQKNYDCDYSNAFGLKGMTIERV